MSINHWRIYCITEQEWSSGYLAAESATPTTCFNNTGHEVNLNSQQIVEVITNNTTNVKIIEESVPTGGNFRCEGFKLTIPAGTTATKVVSWPYIISVLQSFFAPNSSQDGDVLNVICGPNTIVGLLTSSISSGTTVIPVSLTVVQNAMVGYEFLLNGTNLGEIVAIDLNAYTVTLHTATPSSFNAGAYAGLQTTNIKNLVIGLGGGERYIIGASRSGSKRLPANMPVHVTYQNNGANDVDFYFQVEYLY